MGTHQAAEKRVLIHLKLNGGTMGHQSGGRIVAAMLVLLIIAGCSGSAASLEGALKTCGLDGNESSDYSIFALEDGTQAQGVFLYVQDGTGSGGLTIDQATCFMQEVGVPDEVQKRVLISGANTDDRKETWGDFGLIYSRPPSGGLNLSIYTPASVGN
jgi:hypothetical protein